VDKISLMIKEVILGSFYFDNLPIFFQESFKEFENLKFTGGIRWSNTKTPFNGINDLNLEIQPNRLTVLTGKSGSGKSLTAKSLTGLIDVDKSSIFLEIIENATTKWIPLSEISNKDRKKICYLNQNSQMFNGTLRENLSMYDQSISDEAMKETLKTIGLDH
jgi:ABC-type transport system involved in cytochrome bd biosynthesis fused ATPase/permease subunit